MFVYATEKVNICFQFRVITHQSEQSLRKSIAHSPLKITLRSPRGQWVNVRVLSQWSPCGHVTSSLSEVTTRHSPPIGGTCEAWGENESRCKCHRALIINTICVEIYIRYVLAIYSLRRLYDDLKFPKPYDGLAFLCYASRMPTSRFFALHKVIASFGIFKAWH